MEEERSFKPQLNQNSLKIAAKNRPNADVADILMHKKQEYQMKVNEKRMEKENSELVGCTFYPKVLQSPKSENYSYRENSQSRNLLMLNNSSNSLINHQNNVNPGFDLNFMANNLANEILQ